MNKKKPKQNKPDSAKVAPPPQPFFEDLRKTLTLQLMFIQRKGGRRVWGRDVQFSVNQKFDRFLDQPGVALVAREHKFSDFLGMYNLKQMVAASEFSVFGDKDFPRDHWYVPKATFAGVLQAHDTEGGLPHFGMYQAPLPVAFSDHFDSRMLERNGLASQSNLMPDLNKVFGLLPELAGVLELSEPQRFALPYGPGLAVGWVLPVAGSEQNALGGKRVFASSGAAPNTKQLPGADKIFLVKTFLPRSDLSPTYRNFLSFCQELFNDPQNQPIFEYAAFKAHGSVWSGQPGLTEKEATLRTLVQRLVTSDEWQAVASRPLTPEDRANPHHETKRGLPFNPATPLDTTATVTLNLEQFLYGNASRYGAKLLPQSTEPRQVSAAPPPAKPQSSTPKPVSDGSAHSPSGKPKAMIKCSP